MDKDSGKTRGVFLGQVASNEAICDEHFRLKISLPSFPPTRPGQFVQLLCHDPAEPPAAIETTWPENGPPQFSQREFLRNEPLLRRPFSLAGRIDSADGAELTLIQRVVGIGTQWLAKLKPGRPLSLLGPLGNGFTLRPDKPLAALVGGGVGIPPMLYLAEALHAAGKTVVAFNGSRSANLLPLTPEGAPVSVLGRPATCLAEFNRRGASSVVATDDGTLGLPGTVCDAFARWLEQGAAQPADLVVYSCGPEPMMKALGKICIARDIECQLALERRMACGMGTCQSCICKTYSTDSSGGAYKLVCKDGPVFDARDLAW